MNKLIQRLHFTAFLLCLSLHSLTAQKWFCAAQIGTTAYLGDVNERLLWQPQFNRTAISGSIAYKALDFLTVRFNVTAGQLSGSDVENATTDWRTLRAFNFQTPFVETALWTEWDVLGVVNGTHYGDNSRPFSAHLLLGVAISRIMPKVDFNEPNPVSELVNLDKNAVYNRHQVVIPFGVAVKWYITKSSAIRVEATMRKTFSDYFDGISKSAEPKNNDAYLMGSIGLERTLSWGLTGWDKMRFSSARAYCPRF